MDIGLKSARRRLRLEPQRVAGATHDPIVHIGAEAKLPPRPAIVDLQLNGHKRRIFYQDAAFFYWSDEEIFFALALQYGSEQSDQGGSADRSSLVEPSTVGRNSHVNLAAIGRIPEVDRGRSFAGRGFRRTRKNFEPVLAALPFLRHGWS